MMTEHERYLFDLQGFLVIEQAIPAEIVRSLNALLDDQIALVDAPGKTNFRFDQLLHLGSAFRYLIDAPRITPYLVELLGSEFRLDHDYVHIIRQGKGPIGTNLHGGVYPFDPCSYYVYREGRMFNGLTAVAFNLTDMDPGSGGFGCVPGSHKSNLPFPEAWRDLEHPHPCVQAITGKAGSAILFTEALTHGTLPWTGQNERRTLFYKYSPHPSAWARYYYDLERYTDLTPNQQRILMTPGVYPR